MYYRCRCLPISVRKMEFNSSVLLTFWPDVSLGLECVCVPDLSRPSRVQSYTEEHCDSVICDYYRTCRVNILRRMFQTGSGITKAFVWVRLAMVLMFYRKKLYTQMWLCVHTIRTARRALCTLLPTALSVKADNSTRAKLPSGMTEFCLTAGFIKTFLCMLFLNHTLL